MRCLFGTAPRNYQSGGYHKVSMRRACKKRARNLLYLFTFSSLKYSEWAGDITINKEKEGKLILWLLGAYQTDGLERYFLSGKMKYCMMKVLFKNMLLNKSIEYPF